jgi:hypothetical protein
MRMLLIVRLPNETFNAAVRDGTAGPKTKAILDEVRPEAVYFTETNGQRTVVIVVELERPSRVPALAEPWFLTFNAAVEFHLDGFQRMSATSLMRAELPTLSQKSMRALGDVHWRIGLERSKKAKGS